jgi:threonine dehydrogenase-like Zn-dependent dehydrogenase
MKALRYSPPLELVSDAPVPRREGESLVQVISAGICNTDLEITRGYAGFQGILGHEFVGSVVESPQPELVGRRVVGEINVGCGECELCLAGDGRHCARRTVLGIRHRDGAFAEYLSLPARNLFVLPDSITDDQAVFIEPLAAALRVLQQVVIDSSSRVGVVGDGKLAQLIVRVLATSGAQLYAIGKHSNKLDLCREGGARPVPLSDAAVHEGTLDVVVECGGSAASLATAIKLVRPTGTIVLKSTHHGDSSIDVSRIVVNEIKLAGSRCGNFGSAIEFLEKYPLDASSLISARFSLDRAVQAFECAALPEALKVLIQMGS